MKRLPKYLATLLSEIDEAIPNRSLRSALPLNRKCHEAAG